MFILSLLDTTANESESLLPYFIEAAFIYAGLLWFACWGFGINLKEKAMQKAGLVLLGCVYISQRNQTSALTKLKKPK
ncbi:MAG: hypothetical protein ABR577_16995 [Pyrinomonadaceae bacterium]